MNRENDSPEKISQSLNKTPKKFGLFPNANQSVFNLIVNNPSNIKQTPIGGTANLESEENLNLISSLELLPKSDFKRGFIKTNENYHYYLLNEIQSNSYSKSFSAVKYEIKLNPNTNEKFYELCEKSYLIKFYPKALLLEFFSESELLDFQFSLSSKFKSLASADKNIQKIFEIITSNDCILIVTELYEHTLKDFLVKNKDICKVNFSSTIAEFKIEFYYGKLIHDIIMKLNDLSKRGIFCGGLINSNDIYIINFNLQLTDKMRMDFSNSISIEEIEFVLTNPFFYEIETLFKLLEGGKIALTYPPEVLEHFYKNKKQFGLIEIKKNVFLFNTKEHKRLYEQPIKSSILNLQEAKKSQKKVVTQQKIIPLFNNSISSNAINKVVELGLNKEGEIAIENRDSHYGLNNIDKGSTIIRKKSQGINSNLVRSKSKSKKGKLDENKQEFIKEDICLLADFEQKQKFDAWMIGMLIFEIIFIDIPFPRALKQYFNFNNVKSFYFEENPIFSNENLANASSKVQNDLDSFGKEIIKKGLEKLNLKNHILMSILNKNKLVQANKNKKINQNLHFSYLKYGISIIMKELLCYCFKYDWKARIYPTFDDCTDEKIKNFRHIPEDSISNTKNIHNFSDEMSITTVGKIYDIHDTFDNIKGENKNKYIEYLINKNKYLKFLKNKRPEVREIDAFHTDFYDMKYNYEKIDEYAKFYLFK